MPAPPRPTPKLADEPAEMRAVYYSNLTIAFWTRDTTRDTDLPQIVARIRHLLALRADDTPIFTRPPEGEDKTLYRRGAALLPGLKWGTPEPGLGDDADEDAFGNVVMPPNFSWLDGNQVEALLAQVRPKPQLLREIETTANRIRHRDGDKDLYADEIRALKDQLKAAETGIDPATNQTVPLVADPLEPARTLLVRLVTDINWSSTEKYLKRDFGLTFSERMRWTVVLCAAAFFATLWVLQPLAQSLAEKNPESWHALGSYGGLLVAAAAGLVGAVFSRVVTPATTFEAMSLSQATIMCSRSVLHVRLAVGTISAIILYFFFETSVVEFPLFPDLDQLGFRSPSEVPGDGAPTEEEVEEALGLITSDITSVPPEERQEAVQVIAQAVQDTGRSQPMAGRIPNADLSKLMVWSFLAGFSEQLVTRMLEKMERNQNGGGKGNKPGNA